MRALGCVVLVSLVGAAWAEESMEKTLVEENAEKAWHFRIGPVMSPRVRTRVRGPRPSLIIPPVPDYSQSGETLGSIAADPSAGYVDRTYANGYVRPDEGTADDNSMTPGLTWNWGADDVGGQYANGTMEFRTGVTRWTETVSSSAYGMDSSSASDRDILLGVEAMGGWTFFDDGAFDAALDAGFRFYGSGDLSTSSRYGTSVTTTREEYRYVDSYDASGWTTVPSGPHNGSETGPDALIGATPTRREELAGYSTATERYDYRGRTKLDYRIWDLRLGPTVGWKATDCLTIRGGVYGLIGLVDATLKTEYQSADGIYRAKHSKCSAVFGMAASLSAQVNLTDCLFLLGGVEYDWWTDSTSLHAGGADAKIELSDMSVSLAVGIEF
ncbi:MAG: hypothetical protein ACI4R9_04595 [Kiritimatiellia bacterium]